MVISKIQQMLLRYTFATGLVLALASFGSTAWSQDAPDKKEAPKEEAKSTKIPKPKLILDDKSGLFRVQFQSRVQTLYTFEKIKDGAGPAEQNFSIARARLTLKGHAYTKDLKYKFQPDFGKGNVALKDFFIDYKAIDKTLHLRVGQYKRPFSRQQLTSSGSLEMINRALTDKAFGSGRDIGVMVHNNFEKSPDFEYALGVFNGTGDKANFSSKVETSDDGDVKVSGKFSNVPDTFHPAVVARVGFNHGKVKGYKEGDLEGGDFRAGFGLSTLWDLDTDDTDDGEIRTELDGVVKVHHFSFTGGVYHAMAQDDTKFTDQKYDATGFHVQAGYVIGGTVQPVVRFARIDPTGDDNEVDAYTLGVSSYLFGRNVKWQNEATLNKSAAAVAEEEVTAYVFQSQLQFAF
jgi:phosphate-selective porin OprO and OprP